MWWLPPTPVPVASAKPSVQIPPRSPALPPKRSRTGGLLSSFAGRDPWTMEVCRRHHCGNRAKPGPQRPFPTNQCRGEMPPPPLPDHPRTTQIWLLLDHKGLSSPDWEIPLPTIPGMWHGQPHHPAPLRLLSPTMH